MKIDNEGWNYFTDETPAQIMRVCADIIDNNDNYETHFRSSIVKWDNQKLSGYVKDIEIPFAVSLYGKCKYYLHMRFRKKPEKKIRAFENFEEIELHRNREVIKKGTRFIAPLWYVFDSYTDEEVRENFVWFDTGLPVGIEE